MPRPYPAEFRRDVVAVARKSDAPLTQIAKDFGISEATLHNWLKKADVEDGVRPGVTAQESAELRELRKRNRLLEQENEILRRAAAFFARELPPKMIYPLVLDLAADAIPVALTCRVLGFSTQAFYKWHADPVSQRDWDDAHLINAALDVHADDPAFGYRFIADELPRHSVSAGENRVWRLCSQQQIWSTFAKKPGRNRRSGPPVHDDLVARSFTADGPNMLWLTDITEHRTDEGKLYLCAIKGCYSNKIVGYSMGPRMTADLAVGSLRNAIALRDPKATVVHSDRGSQFRSRAYVEVLTDNGLQGSMGRVGACGDNAAMESFFALLQKNVLDRQRWASREELRLAIVTWIERTYNRRRRQRGLGRLTPVEYETLNQAPLAA
ncbi:IS3 family transposase [Rhodococcus sp. D2-41]|uniref:IS3 family transposase n=1 Tax=Speluncibacter jeojiensis TaxID=2710754 RepID=A0A9X4M0W9_9ACTN|nr:IS3 family transposase [Rhodococcus sp. D2-41]MDG3011498.1 IS3 family transposase [Rhodococcus sp. D2-41]MDG3015146.1 IS3 family transposase [Corynebacteriales bacterium D3-21]